MGSPARLCPLCANPGHYTVEQCSVCNRPHCKKHILWSKGMWVCRRCANKEAKSKETE